MSRSEKYNYFKLTGLVIGAELIDLALPIPANPYYILYLYGALIDASVFYLVYLLLYKTYSNLVFAILILQSLSISAQFGGFLIDMLYFDGTMYSFTVRAIFLAKVAVLMVGGFGIFRRYNRADFHWDNHPGVVVPNGQANSQSNEGN